MNSQHTLQHIALHWLTSRTHAAHYRKCATWMIHLRDVTPLMIHLRDVLLHTSAWRTPSYICVTYSFIDSFIHLRVVLLHRLLHTSAWRDSFTCVTWLVLMCDTTHTILSVLQLLPWPLHLDKTRAIICCCVLLCVAVYCSVLQCVAVYGSVLQCVAVCCSYNSSRQGSRGIMPCVAVCCSVLLCVAVCCSVLQYVAVCYSVLQCVAVCGSVW